MTCFRLQSSSDLEVVTESCLGRFQQARDFLPILGVLSMINNKKPDGHFERHGTVTSSEFQGGPTESLRLDRYLFTVVTREMHPVPGVTISRHVRHRQRRVPLP